MPKAFVGMNLNPVIYKWRHGEWSHLLLKSSIISHQHVNIHFQVTTRKILATGLHTEKHSVMLSRITWVELWRAFGWLGALTPYLPKRSKTLRPSRAYEHGSFQSTLEQTPMMIPRDSSAQGWTTTNHTGSLLSFSLEHSKAIQDFTSLLKDKRQPQPWSNKTQFHFQKHPFLTQRYLLRPLCFF